MGWDVAHKRRPLVSQMTIRIILLPICCETGGCDTILRPLLHHINTEKSIISNQGVVCEYTLERRYFYAQTYYQTISHHRCLHRHRGDSYKIFVHTNSDCEIRLRIPSCCHACNPIWPHLGRCGLRHWRCAGNDAMAQRKLFLWIYPLSFSDRNSLRYFL